MGETNCCAGNNPGNEGEKYETVRIQKPLACVLSA